MTIDWMVFCESATSDDDERASIIGIYEDVEALELPFNLPSLALAIHVTGTAGESGRLVIDIVRPRGGLAMMHAEIGVTMHESGSVTIPLPIGDGPVTMTQLGRYRALVSLGTSAREASFLVSAEHPPQRVSYQIH